MKYHENEIKMIELLEILLTEIDEKDFLNYIENEYTPYEDYEDASKDGYEDIYEGNVSICEQLKYLFLKNVNNIVDGICLWNRI